MKPDALTWEAAVKQLQAASHQRELVEACFYDDPLIDAAKRYHACCEWQAVRRLIGSAAGTALDLGSGRGISAYALARDGWEVTALEPDPSDVVGAGAIRALAAEAGLSIRVVETWGEQLPFDAASFDVVHCRQVLHHARDLAQLCREAARVLKPGGAFIATREHVISRREDLEPFLDAHPLHRLYGGEHAYLRDEYTDAIARAGIRIESVFNPLQSDINTFPASRQQVKQRWARKLHLPFPGLIPDVALSWAGAADRTPGRLYTFFGRKANAAAGG